MSTGASGATGPSGAQQAGAQASGSPVSSSATGATGTTATTGTTVKFEWPTWSWPTLEGPTSLFLVAYLLFFHVGAGVLSYRKYGSMGWAVIASLLAYFYYPYYAFTATSPAPEAAPAPLIGGLLKAALKGGKSRRR